MGPAARNALLAAPSSERFRDRGSSFMAVKERIVKFMNHTTSHGDTKFVPTGTQTKKLFSSVVIAFILCSIDCLPAREANNVFASCAWKFGWVIIGIILWNLHLDKREKVTLSAHFNAVCRAIRIFAFAKDAFQSKFMPVIIRNRDGAIELIDGALLTFLGYNESKGPKNVYDIFEKTEPMTEIFLATNTTQQISLDRNVNLSKVWARRNDGSHVRVALATNLLSSHFMEAIVFRLEPDKCYSRSHPVGDLVTQSNQVLVGEELSLDEAFVVLLTIVKNWSFSRSSSKQVLTWMRRLHAIIEIHLAQHGVRLVEAHGDCFLAVAAARDGPRPASRAVHCVSAIARAARAQEGASIRAGVACGPATIARLQCPASAGGGSGGGGGEGGGGGGGEAQLLFGDVANVAGRLEQSGDAASVHVCGRTARSFAEEQGIACPPIEVRAPLVTLGGGDFGGTQKGAH